MRLRKYKSRTQTVRPALEPARYPAYSRRCAARPPAGERAGFVIFWLKRALPATMDTVAEKTPNTSEHRERNARSQLIKLREGNDPALRTKPERGGRILLQEKTKVEKKLFRRMEDVEDRRFLGRNQNNCLETGRSCAYCRVICRCMVPPGTFSDKGVSATKRAEKNKEVLVRCEIILR